jgi:hypothetical protein
MASSSNQWRAPSYYWFIKTSTKSFIIVLLILVTKDRPLALVMKYKSTCKEQRKKKDGVLGHRDVTCQAINVVVPFKNKIMAKFLKSAPLRHAHRIIKDQNFYHGKTNVIGILCGEKKVCNKITLTFGY